MLNFLKNYISNFTATFNPTASKCIVCGHKVNRFLPLSPHYEENMKLNGFPFSLNDAETLNLDAYTCPRCGAADRDRLYALFFEKNIHSDKTYKLLDIAPAKSLTKFLRGFKNVQYRSADLFMPGVDDKVDITDMHLYSDNTFDIFICSHVLEHVPDDRKAMRELFRVLKPGGWGITMVPILKGVHEVEEDPAVQEESERWRRFGQDDHIRLYSKHGFKQRLTEVGFQVVEYKQGYFSSEELSSNAITPDSVLYVVYK